MNFVEFYFCCGEFFDVPIWHCPYCAHHWLFTEGQCRNCYANKGDLSA